LKKGFRTEKTKPAEWRKQQLRQLKRGIEEMKEELIDALEKDLGNSRFASELSHVIPCIWDIDYSLENVEKVRPYFI
jgi:aldehyde dehydrogenase (NAD+)